MVASGAVDGATLGRIKAMLLASRAPVIHAGAGVKWGRGTANLLKLAEALQQWSKRARPGMLAPMYRESL